jgi:hypothetical protein
MAALTEAVQGLTYPSESDAPFDVFGGDRRPSRESAESVVAARHPDAPAAEVSVDQFFRELEGTEQAERFAALRRVLEATLSDVRVMRVGAVKVDVYLVGRNAGGGWVGLHTTSVET